MNNTNIDTYTSKLIRFKARQLMGKTGLGGGDWDDLVQEMWLEVLERMPRFDPQKSKKETFTSLLVDNRISKVLAYRRAAMRYWRFCSSLNVELTDQEEDVNEGIDLLGDDGCMAEYRGGYREQEQAAIRFDVGRILTCLEPELQELCRWLPFMTMKEISKKTGVPRSTLYARLARIRKAFAELA